MSASGRAGPGQPPDNGPRRRWSHRVANRRPRAPRGVAGPDDAARLALTLAIISMRPVQVGLGVLGDGPKRLGLDGEPALAGQGECHGRHRLVVAGKAIAVLGILDGAGLDQKGQRPDDRRADRFGTGTAHLIRAVAPASSCRLAAPARSPGPKSTAQHRGQSPRPNSGPPSHRRSPLACNSHSRSELSQTGLVRATETARRSPVRCRDADAESIESGPECLVRPPAFPFAPRRPNNSSRNGRPGVENRLM